MTNEPEEPTEEPSDPFEGCSPLEGLSYLGRAILDESGNPSGSPANFEQLRGSPYPPGWVSGAVAAAEGILADAARRAIAEEYPPEPPEVPTDA